VCLLCGKPTLSRTINLKDFGIKCDGIYDNSPLINKILKGKINRSLIIFPEGICNISQPITLSALYSTIEGTGGSSTTILYTGKESKNIISLADSYQSHLRGFGVWSKNKLSHGSAINIEKSSYIFLEDLYLNNTDQKYQNIWNSLSIDRPNFVYVSKLYAQAQNDAVDVSGSGVGSTFQYDVFIDHSKLSDSSVGLHIGGGIDNVHISSSEITSNYINVLDDNSISNFKNQEIYIDSGTVCDQSTASNIIINDKLCDTRNYGVVSLSGPITGSKHGSGIEIVSMPNCQVIVSSPFIDGNEKGKILMRDKTTHVAIK